MNPHRDRNKAGTQISSKNSYSLVLNPLMYVPRMYEILQLIVSEACIGFQRHLAMCPAELEAMWYASIVFWSFSFMQKKEKRFGGIFFFKTDIHSASVYRVPMEYKLQVAREP